MNFFHYLSYSPPWGVVLGLIVIITLYATFLPYRWYSKDGKPKALAWTQAILTGLGVGFVVTVFSVVLAANSLTAIEQDNKTALRAFAEHDYGLKLDDENLNLLYWSKDEGEVPVAATTKSGDLQEVYLKSTKDGWLLYDKNTKAPLQQSH